MSPKDILPKYSELTQIERFWLRSCFRFVPETEDVGIVKKKKSWEQRLEESSFFLKKAFGKDIFHDFESKKILDFGCGEGHFSLAIALNAEHAEVTGLDIQDRFSEANSQIKIRGLSNLRFILGGSDRFPDNSFDYILSHDSFEHFDKPSVVLKEMTRLLKPGGRLMIKFGPTWMGPYGRHMFNVFRKDRPWMHLIIPERSVMRIYSVIKRLPVLHESYTQYPDGLNKMTVGRAKSLFYSNDNTRVTYLLNTNYLEGKGPLKYFLRHLLSFSLFQELFSKELIAVLEKTAANSAS